MSPVPAIGPQRRAFLAWLLMQDGKTSLWGAKGDDCFDCSGLVTCGLVAAGCSMFEPKLTNTDLLWAKCQEITIPSPGDLVLYGGSASSDVEHVMCWWGDGTVFGACGATSKITTREAAEKAGARVRLRKLSYRRDYRGLRRVPLDMKDLLAKQREIA